ncbi:HpcH/HpaI aldolase, partial [human gut metagenome]
CETAEALDIIEDICAVDGVDGIFVGPFDLSISMGMPGQFDAPEFQAAITRIVAACHAAGKYCMFFTGTADGVVDGFRRGFNAMAYSLDAALFIQGVKRNVEDIRSRLQ